jgi:hypothetical protein
MAKVLNNLDLLENKLKVLLERYEFLLEENRVLSKSYNTLFQNYQKRGTELELREKQFESLKLSKTFEGSIEDKRNTKRKINHLIREIDKCIIQLDE